MNKELSALLGDIAVESLHLPVRDFGPAQLGIFRFSLSRFLGIDIGKSSEGFLSTVVVGR